MKKCFFVVVAVIIGVVVFSLCGNKERLPVVAIANYGQLIDLEKSIDGIKTELADNGFIENKTIRYEIADIAFDHALIPQIIESLRNGNPNVLVVVSTPIAQFAKGKVYDMPVIFHAITDPIDAGLIKIKNQSENNITGSSDMQDLDILVTFAKSILPNAKTIGLLHLTSDNNDASLLNMMRSAASVAGMSVIAIPVDQIRDIPVRMQGFKGKVDLIYVGASGLHAAMPVIASEAQKMHVPVFNSEEQAVRDGLALASFGVSYELIGRNTGKLIAKLLNGADVKSLAPIYPSIQEHRCFINKSHAEKFGIKIPKNAIVVE